MGAKTGIQWTDHTWNPIRGCSRVSDGCVNCYAERDAYRFSGRPGDPYYGLVTSKARWNGQIRTVWEHMTDPLRWTKPRMVFVNSMSDLFHPNVPEKVRRTIWAIMGAAQMHTFQVLTKRPGEALAFLQRLESETLGPVATMAAALRDGLGTAGLMTGKVQPRRPPAMVWPFPNVWLGASVEHQAAADERLPLLLQCPAALRFASYEPALGPIDFKLEWLVGAFDHCPDPDTDECMGCPGYSVPGGDYCGAVHGPSLGWIIVGGESGPGARPFDLDWARNTVAQGEAAGVPIFVKQMGSVPMDHGGPVVFRARKGGDPWEWPGELRRRQWPQGITR